MKITINIDCTPEEARRYMGLPDVAPMQEALLKQMQDRMTENLSSMQPTELIRTWLPMGLEGWLEMQKAFWSRIAAAGKSEDTSR